MIGRKKYGGVRGRLKPHKAATDYKDSNGQYPPRSNRLDMV